MATIEAMLEEMLDYGNRNSLRKNVSKQLALANVLNYMEEMSYLDREIELPDTGVRYEELLMDFMENQCYEVWKMYMDGVDDLYTYKLHLACLGMLEKLQ